MIEGRPPIAPGDEPSLETRSVLGDYFHSHEDSDAQRAEIFKRRTSMQSAPLVGIANDEMVRQYFPNENPLGKRHSLGA